MRNAIVSLLLPRNQGVLEDYVRSRKCVVLTMRGHYAGVEGNLPQRITSLGGETVFIEDMISPQLDGILRSEAIQRAQLAFEGFNASAAAEPFADFGISAAEVTEVFGATIHDDFYQSMRVVEALTLAAQRFAIELVAVNEDVGLQSKTSALWAKSVGIPALHLSHSAIIGTLIPVHQERNTSDVVFFGEKAIEAYSASGVDISGAHIIGNPAWDRYAPLLADRDHECLLIRQRLGIANEHDIIVFATTWASNFSALSERSVWEDTLRAVFEAFAALPRRSRYRLVVKDRLVNSALVSRVGELAAAAGLDPECWTYTMDGLPSLLVAAAAVIVVNSNVAIEAAICDVPAINLWSPASWLTGPYFDALEGVPEIPADALAVALERVLDEPSLRGKLLDMARAALPRVNVTSDGSSSKRVSDLMLRFRAHSALESAEAALQQARLDQCLAHVEGSYDCALAVSGSPGSENTPGNVRRVSTANKSGALTAEDLYCAGIRAGAVDLAIFAHTLEEIYDPWTTLRNLRPFLTAGARVVIAVDNMRSFRVLESLVRGDYDDNGDDIRKRRILRRFTARQLICLLTETGFRVSKAVAIIDPAYAATTFPSGTGTLAIDLPSSTLKAIPLGELAEWTAAEFILTAHPA